jgi:hypothetical protein
MLGAVMFGHKAFQPVIDAIIKLAEVAAKEPRDFRRKTFRDSRDRDAGDRGPSCAKPTRTSTSSEALCRGRRRQGQVVKAAFGAPVAKSRPNCRRQGRFRVQGTPGQGRALEHPRHQEPHRRPRPQDGPPIVSEVGVLPRTHGSALFTRGETQAIVVATLGTGEDEQYHRLADRHVQGELPAALQLPALLGRRDGPHGFARAAAKSATASSPGAPSVRCCRPSRAVPLHDPRRLRDHRVERLVLDGDRLRHLAGADGCGRAAAKAPSPASPWA